MSAQQAPLSPWIQEMVDLQVLSMLEAQTLEDFWLQTPEGEIRMAPAEMADLLQRVWLHEQLSPPQSPSELH